MTLDALNMVNYNIGGAVDVSAPVQGAVDQIVAANSSGVDLSTMNFEEWARRKNASYRRSITVITIAGLDILMSLDIRGKSTVQRIGEFMSTGPLQFWSFWVAKMAISGYIFSRVFPWGAGPIKLKWKGQTQTASEALASLLKAVKA